METITPKEIYKAFAMAAEAVENLGKALRKLQEAKNYTQKSKYHR